MLLIVLQLLSFPSSSSLLFCSFPFLVLSRSTRSPANEGENPGQKGQIGEARRNQPEPAKNKRRETLEPASARPAWKQLPYVTRVRPSWLHVYWSYSPRREQLYILVPHASHTPGRPCVEHNPASSQLYMFWLRTNGLNTNGAAAKIIDFDRLGKKVRPGTFWGI